MRKFVFRPSGYQQYVNIGTQTVHSVKRSECLHVSASTRHNCRAHVTVTQRPQEPIPAGHLQVHHVEAVFMGQKAPSLCKAFRPQTHSMTNRNTPQFICQPSHLTPGEILQHSNPCPTCSSEQRLLEFNLELLVPASLPHVQILYG